MTPSDSAPTVDLLDRLQAGETPAQVCRVLNLSPTEAALALGHCVLGSDNPADWPGLTQARPRRDWLAPALAEAAWAEAFPHSPRTARLALAAGLLQIHDFWDASHNAAQDADDQGERDFSAYWHGIAHRREPDPGNASYWFRRVGRHPLFTRLAHEVRPLLEAHPGPGDPLNLTPVWNPFAVIDLCTTAPAGSDRATLALKIQRLEMTVLLEATVGSLA